MLIKAFDTCEMAHNKPILKRKDGNMYLDFNEITIPSPFDHNVYEGRKCYLFLILDLLRQCPDKRRYDNVEVIPIELSNKTSEKDNHDEEKCVALPSWSTKGNF